MRKFFSRTLLLAASCLLPSMAMAQVALGNGGGVTPPGGATGNIQYNNNGQLGGYTPAQLQALFSAFSNTTPGLVPAGGGGNSSLFLNGAGAFTAPPTTAPSSLVSSGTTTPVTGATDTAPPSTFINYFRAVSPSGTIATLTEPLPTTPFSGQVYTLYFTAQVTALTLTGTQSLWTNGATATVGTHIRFTYNAADSSWE